MKEEKGAWSKAGRRVLYGTSFPKMVLLCVPLVFLVLKGGVGLFPLKESVLQTLAEDLAVDLAIPTFDSRVYCHEVSASVAPDVMQEVYQKCFQAERKAYTMVDKMWAEVPSEAKRQCLRFVRPGDGTYFLLWDCLVEKQKSEKPRAHSHF